MLCHNRLFAKVLSKNKYNFLLKLLKIKSEKILNNVQIKNFFLFFIFVNIILLSIISMRISYSFPIEYDREECIYEIFINHLMQLL